MIQKNFKIIQLIVNIVVFQVSLAQDIAPTISTSCGDISGDVVELNFNMSSVFRYSLRYGMPPTQELRWRAPSPAYCGWSGVINGSIVPPFCVQPSSWGDEDCLFLNVLVPKDVATNIHSSIPVVVYFHGGGLVTGSAVDEIGNAAALASQTGFVTVTIGYRLGVLGWLGITEFADEQDGVSGNYGLQDAILGLQWVRDHIASFGGDPSHVTISGQSSGGTLCLALMASPSAVGLFTGAFSMSGSPNITMGSASKFSQDAPIVASLGCENFPTASARLTCLRALPALVVGASMPDSWSTRLFDTITDILHDYDRWKWKSHFILKIQLIMRKPS
jgi:para-nitrobenzyl esterase